MSENKESSPPAFPEVPEEFRKIIKDFISDMVNTFSEYEGIINKWWKPKEFKDVSDDKEREALILEDSEKKVKFVFKHCVAVFPERFFEILYKNDEMFHEDSIINTEFLPGISFKYLWQLDISEKTRETIWKYLQLISISVVGSVQNRDAFGDTAKIFESINEDEFKGKLEETLEKMQEMFEQQNNGNEGEGEGDGEGEGENGKKSGINMNNMPSADDIHGHISGMMSGKLGNLAREIAEETANDLNIDMENITDIKDVFQNIFKNPGKLMGLVKNVGEKLDSKIKSGDIKESELISEASEMMNKMKNMPGMDNIQSMLGKMGMGGLGGGKGKVNMNAMQAQMERNLKLAQMKERMKKKSDTKETTSAPPVSVNTNPNNSFNGLTDEQLLSVFSNAEKPERTPRNVKPQNNGSGVEKKKKNKKK